MESTNIKEEQNIKTVRKGNIGYSLDDKECTATVKWEYYFDDEELLIPSSIIHDSKEYIVNTIAKFAFYQSNFKIIRFASDSKIKTIEEDSFYEASIESLEIPSYLTELKNGWCNETRRLTNIKVDPDNPRYKVYENKFIIGKSYMEQDNYDILVFCVRNIETVNIPDFIEILNKNVFDECINLRNIQFSNNSKLKIIENCAFSRSSIDSISIPSGTIDIYDGWCEETAKLTKITVMPNNPRYLMYDGKYLVGKSSMDKDNYDTLLFCVRDIRDAIIPDFIEIIGSNAFDECHCIKSIQFSTESKLQLIKNYAFYNCSLRTISIPASVQKIGKFAFGSCKYLSHIDIPMNSELKIIEEDAFYNTAIEDFFIPSSLTELKGGWCHNLKKLNKITVMPDNQRYIVYEGKYLLGKSSFEKENFDVLLFCIRNIEKAKIPDFIEMIDICAFEYCHILEVEISTNSNLSIIGIYSFYCSSIKSIYIPPSVTEIKNYAFSLCDKLKIVEIPNESNLRIIDEGAFSGSSIEKITIPLHLQKIGQCAFKNCIELKYIEIPEKAELKIIKNNAFNGTSIETFFVPPHLVKIDACAFYSCQNLKEIIIPENAELQIIGNRAFYNTMIKSLLIPSCLTYLEEGWCENTNHLFNINVLPNNPRYQLYLNRFVIEKSPINSLIFCVRNISFAIIPNYIEIISPYSFYGCKNLREIFIENNSKLKIIDRYAFSESSLGDIKIPSHLEQIKEGAFSNCNGFTFIDIPFDSKLDTIENFAFFNTSIFSFSIPQTLLNLNIRWSIGTDFLTNINVIEGNKRYMLYDNQLLLEKSSIEQDNYDILNFAVRDIVDAIIPNSIEIIEKNAFNGCNMLQKIFFPSQSKLRVIEKYAFNGSSIESITIPSNLVELKDGWCCHTNKLTSFSVMPRNKNFMNLENNFIVGKTDPNNFDFDLLILARRNIKNCKIPSFIKKIGPFSFQQCDQLEQIYLSSDSKLDEIDQYAFDNSSITSFYANFHLCKIDDYAFNFCTKLNRFIFPMNSELEIIGKESFAFSSIQSITIPSSVIKIGIYAFNSCSLLKIIEISKNSNLEEIKENMFINCKDILIMVSIK